MYRTHNNGQLRIEDVNQKVKLCGWVQKSRDLGGMTFIDLRDRYGITQLAFNETLDKTLSVKARKLNREWVIEVEGIVKERSSKNLKIDTGEIEIEVDKFTVLNKSKTPPFTIEDETDGGEELRMKYRFLDLRRTPLQENLALRSEMSIEIRNFFHQNNFLEIETPYLIKSTPEGARDFVVPSRMNKQQFYALPQSPQTFKQLLMVSGYDRYFQIVKCFRDEDLRADRQPEFTQIDCEMSFVNQEDILNTFEGLVRHLLSSIKNINVDDFPRMTYDQAMSKYGCDKPDIRFGMELGNLNEVSMHKEFNVFNSSELVVGIAVPNGNTFTRKQIDSYTNWVKRPQIGAKGLVYVRCNDDGSFKSSVDKFYDQEDLGKWANITGAVKGDLIFILSGEVSQVRAQISALRLEVAENLDLRKSDEFAPLWVTDFPLLEWDAESQKYHAMHHPFTSPKLDQLDLLEKSPAKVKANAYDLVLNGNEIGGGSIRIHDKKIQGLMFKHLGFSEVQAKEQFGFLMNAFEYGAPPHGGIALGLDRLVAILHGEESIKDYIAFPKNNSGKDVMIDAPSKLDDVQLNELSLKLKSSK